MPMDDLPSVSKSFNPEALAIALHERKEWLREVSLQFVDFLNQYTDYRVIPDYDAPDHSDYDVIDYPYNHNGIYRDHGFFEIQLAPHEVALPQQSFPNDGNQEGFIIISIGYSGKAMLYNEYKETSVCYLNGLDINAAVAKLITCFYENRNSRLFEELLPAEQRLLDKYPTPKR